MNRNNNVSVETFILSLGKCRELSVIVLEKIDTIINDNGNYPANIDSGLLELVTNLSRMKDIFSTAHSSIVLGNSISAENIERYYEKILESSMLITLLEKKLNKVNNDLIQSSSMSRDIIEKFKELVTSVMNVYSKLIAIAKSFEPSEAPVSQIPVTTQVDNNAIQDDYSGEVKIMEMGEEAKSHFNQYLTVAKYTDLNDDPLLGEIVGKIHDLSKGFYSPGINVQAPNILSYASIVGPSLMGKTQFAFALARLCPVFYTNFAYREQVQPIYDAFKDISAGFKNCLADDVKILEKEPYIGLNSGDILGTVKLRTIGLLWELVKYSTKFDGFKEGSASNSDWFTFYLQSRNFKYEAMTYCEYLEELGKDYNEVTYCLTDICFIDELIKDPKIDFRIPVVFIDEINSKNEDSIKLLRNLCRLIGLECVMASTSAKINNLLNVKKPGSSAPKANAVWVHAIRKLPKASIKAIFKLLGWDAYATDPENFQTSQLLSDLAINTGASDTNSSLLHNLITLMIHDSRTCLQGVSLIAFSALKDKLLELKSNKQLLDTKAVFEYILDKLSEMLKSRKAAAFSDSDSGPYNSLAMMMSNYQIYEENDEIEGLCNLKTNSEIIFRTINEHFYFFGKPDDLNIIPFGYMNKRLTIGVNPYKICSHFKLFLENTLFCMALWKGVNMELGDKEPSVASIVSDSIHELNNFSGNAVALKNDSATQESMVHWALCYSTMRNVSELNPGAQFLERFINLIQLKQITVNTNNSSTSKLKPKKKVVGLRNRFKLKSCPELETFLANIKIPYLLPPNNVTKDIEQNLLGLCRFGTCSRQADQRGIDIEFDLLYHDDPMQGFVECKYVDGNLSKKTVLDYIIRTREKNSPFSMIVTFSLQKRLKDANLWQAEDYTEEDEEEDEKQTSDDSENLLGKRNKLDSNALSAEEEQRKIEERQRIEERRRKRILEEREMESKISGISIYSVYYAKNDLKIVPLVKVPNPTGIFMIIQTNFFVPKK